MGRVFGAMPEGQVFEFGKLIHLDVESEVSDYLHHLDGWFRGLKKPKTWGSCVAKVNTFLKGKQHRHLALILLAQSGNPMARLFLAVKRGTVEQQGYDDFSMSEAQFLSETMSIVLIFITILGLVMNQRKLGEAIYLGRNVASKAMKTLTKTGKNVSGAMKQIAVTCSDTSDLASKLTNGLASVENACQVVVDWIRSMYAKVKGILKKVSSFVYVFAKIVVMFSIIVIAVEVLKVIVSFSFKQVLEYIAQVFGLPQSIKSWWGSQAQAKENFLPRFLEGIYEYGFGKPSKVFTELLGPRS